MFIAGMVHHQIHDELHAALMHTVQHLTECLHTAELRSDVHIIRNIIAAVGSGGRIDGRKPDAVTPQTFEIIQFFQNAPQIAHTVTVAVLKAPGPDLIEHHVFIPAVSLHIHSSTPFD